MDHLQIFGATSIVPLRVAYEENHMEVLSFLLSEEVVNHWNLPLDFMLFAKYLIQSNDFDKWVISGEIGHSRSNNHTLVVASSSGSICRFNISLIQTKDKA